MKKVIILLAIIVALTGCFGKKKEEEKKKSTKENIVEIKEKAIIENREYQGIKIENISFNYDGKYTNMSFNIINGKTDAVTIGRYDVIIKDEKGEELGKLESFLPNEIQPGETLEITLSLDKDFTKAKSADFNFSSLNE